MSVREAILRFMDVRPPIERIPLSLAHVCESCGCVVRAPHGRCTVCTSEATWPLAGLLREAMPASAAGGASLELVKMLREVAQQ
jgi:hypothetical protein